MIQAKTKRGENFLSGFALCVDLFFCGYFATHKCYAQYDGKVDCHDLLKASLAMTKYFRFQATSAEVALGKFVGFQARNCEIRLIVY